MKNKCNFIGFAVTATLLSGSVAFASDDNETFGAITAVSPNGISVAGEGFVFGSNVECEYLNHVHFSCGQLVVGDTVKVEWTGNRVAREIKLYNAAAPTPTPSASPTPTATPREDRKKERESKLSVRLRSDDVGVRPSGKAEFESKKKEQKLTIKVRIPEGSSPLIETPEDAEALEIKAQIIRDAAIYAECTFDLDDDSDDENSNIYEFKVDIRNKKGTLREKSGTCVIDPDGAATAGLPELKRQDSVKIIEDSAGEFLTGTVR